MVWSNTQNLILCHDMVRHIYKDYNKPKIIPKIASQGVNFIKVTEIVELVDRTTGRHITAYDY